jgi:hypothetical protein
MFGHACICQIPSARQTNWEKKDGDPAERFFFHPLPYILLHGKSGKKTVHSERSAAGLSSSHTYDHDILALLKPLQKSRYIKAGETIIRILPTIMMVYIVYGKIDIHTTYMV